MFILRRITSEGKESNEVLGESYNKVHEWQKEDFESFLKPWPEPEKIFGFVVYNQGAKLTPLYKKSEYYVMCSDGKTFEKIKF